MRFPQWAPSILCELYLNEYAPYAGHWKETLLKRLLTDERMQRVWRLFLKHPPRIPNAYVAFYSKIEQTLHESTVPRETKGQLLKQLDDLEQAARTLCIGIGDTVFDESAYHYFPSKSLRTILEKVYESHIENAKGWHAWYGLPPPEPEDDNDHNVLNLRRLTIETTFPDTPLLSELLQSLIDEIRRVRSQVEASEPIVKQTKNSSDKTGGREFNVGRRYFVRVMADEFKKRFGSYKRAKIALLASVALKLETGEDYVKDQLKAKRGGEIERK